MKAMALVRSANLRLLARVVACAAVWMFPAVFCAPAPGAIIKAWEQSYDSGLSGNTSDKAVTILSIGTNFVSVGSSSDFGRTGTDILLIKYAGANGATVWTQKFNTALAAEDYPQDAVVDAEGNVYVASQIHGGATGHNIHTAKFAATDGSLLWARTFSGVGFREDKPAKVLLDPQGNVFVAGFTTTAATNENKDFFVARYRGSDGEVLWEKSFGSGGHDTVSDIAVDRAGDVTISGSSDFRWYVATLRAADGTLAWEKIVGGPGIGYIEGVAVEHDADNNPVVTGTRFTDSYDIYTAKYARADGALIWERTYSGPDRAEDIPKSLVIDRSGGVIIGGYSTNALLLLKFGRDGSDQWQARIPGEQWRESFAQDLVTDAQDNVLVAGSLNVGGYAAKFSGATGLPIWQITNAPTMMNVAIALNSEGQIGLIGPRQETDLHTSVVGATDGTLLWETNYDRAANSHDTGWETAIDALGNVIVAGGTGASNYVSKYAKADGRVLWERVDDRTINSVAVNAAGDIFITGFVSLNTNRFEMFAAKRNGGDGALAWERRASSEERSSLGFSVGMDTNGNPKVISIHSLGSSNDVRVITYSAGDGTVISEKLYPGAAVGTSVLRTLLVDEAEDLYVGDFRSTPGTDPQRPGSANQQPILRRYSSNDGALAWEWAGPRGTSAQWPILEVKLVGGQLFVAGGAGVGAFAAKLAPATGRAFWERSAPMRLPLQHLAVDSAGNLTVAGSTLAGEPPGTSVAKFSTANGDLLWEKHFTDAARRLEPKVLLVDESDDLILGISSGYARSNEWRQAPLTFTVSKLSGLDGAVVSESTTDALEPVGFAYRGGGELTVTGSTLGDLGTVLFLNEPRLRVAVEVRSAGLEFRWAEAHRGARLERTSSLGGTGSWTALPLATATNRVTIPIDASQGFEFYRLVGP